MEDEVRRLAQRARLRQVGDVIAALAHDFGQPLNIIRLAAENGLDSCGQDAAQKRAYDLIGLQAERVQARMQALVALCRAGRAADPLDVVEALDLAVARVAPRCAAEGVALEWLRPVGPAWVRAHPAQVATVVETLLENACDAVLHARLTRPATGITVTCAVGAEVAITVADDGPGMPPSVSAAVQDPFAAVPGARPGIGLLLTAGIVAELAGTLSIDVADRGTRATASFPLVALDRPNVL
jgi:two-component system C4-dicarboxylate transport sensor histidine kinase DctB